MQIKQNFLRMLFCCELVLFSGFYFFGSHGLRAVTALKNENAQLEQEISAIDDEVDALGQSISAWDEDSFYAEKHARENLAMGRNGEDVYLI